MPQTSVTIAADLREPFERDGGLGRTAVAADRDGQLLGAVLEAVLLEHVRGASAMTSPLESGISIRPAPSAWTCSALKNWSRPIGVQSSGTPCASAASVVPSPACVITSEAEGSTWVCGT